jgi:hypothetical protein
LESSVPTWCSAAAIFVSSTLIFCWIAASSVSVLAAASAVISARRCARSSASRAWAAS